MPEVTETPEYRKGFAWTTKNIPKLRELFTATELATSELRVRLFDESEKIYPAQKDSMDFELQRTAFVAGAYHALTELIPGDRPGAIAIFDAALEMGSIYGSEGAKKRALNELKEKPESWWLTNAGDAPPDAVVRVLARRWMREFSKEKGHSRPSRWEILIDTLASREMLALAELNRIEFKVDGKYKRYYVDGVDADFEVMAQAVYDGGIMTQGAGDIVG